MSAETAQTISPEERAIRESQVVCRAIFVLQEDLNLKVKDLEIILGVDRKTLGRWKEKGAIPNLSGHLRQATSHLISIYRSLLAMFSSPIDRRQWIHTGHMELILPPVELIRDLEGLIRVRRYLDYVRGRGA